jgi:hypothetical protein
MFKLGRLFSRKSKDADVDQFIRMEYGLEVRNLMKNGIPQDVAIEGIRNRVKL